MRSLDSQRKEILERILAAQYLLCKAADTNPDEEPFIQELRSSIKALDKGRHRT